MFHESSVSPIGEKGGIPCLPHRCPGQFKKGSGRLLLSLASLEKEDNESFRPSVLEVGGGVTKGAGTGGE